MLCFHRCLFVHGRGMHGRRACGRGTACVVGVGDVGACMVGGACVAGGVHGMHAPWHILQDTVNEWAVHILLECILVLHFVIRVILEGKRINSSYNTMLFYWQMWLTTFPVIIHEYLSMNILELSQHNSDTQLFYSFLYLIELKDNVGRSQRYSNFLENANFGDQQIVTTTQRLVQTSLPDQQMPTGLPHDDQGKIPRVFPVFLTFSLFIFWPQNITVILLPLPIEKYTITNIHFKSQFQMLQSLLQKPHSIIRLSPNPKSASKPKDCFVAVYYHNPGTSFNYKTFKFSVSEVNSLYKTYF